METTKDSIENDNMTTENRGFLPTECVEICSEEKRVPRLKKLVGKYPDMRDEFKQFFRDNGFGDWSFYNVENGRTKMAL